MLFKRKVQLAVISDVHLGTFGCHAKELLQYLNSIEPEILILNGDIIDIWQFSKRYWPASHMMVINHLINLISSGTKIYYITGNHDEMLRKFTGFGIANSPSGAISHFLRISHGRIRTASIFTPSYPGLYAVSHALEGLVFTDFPFVFDSFGVHFADAAR